MLPPKRPEAAPEVALPWIVRLRYVMAAGQMTTAVFASQFLRIDLPLGWIALGPALVIASNLWLAQRVRGSGIVPLSSAMGAIFALDISVLTGLLALAGGPTNPFSLLYLVHITLAATILTKRQTWLLGVLSTVGFGLLFLKYRPIAALEVHRPADGLNLHLTGMWVSFAIAAFLVAMFSAKISELLRERELSLLEMQEKLAKKDRLASLVTLAAGAAHELGTPLSTIALVARELERYATTTAQIPAVAEDSRLIRTEVDRCRAILERLSIEGAEPAGEALQRVRVTELFDAVLSHFHRADVRSEISSESCLLTIPRHAVEQALIALVKNALDASRNAAPVLLTAASIPDAMEFLVRDKGHGMSPETLRHVGEPFFTTKDPGSGMGLGIFLVRTLAERLGGSLRFESVLGSGTTAYFELPVSNRASVSAIVHD